MTQAQSRRELSWRVRAGMEMCLGEVWTENEGALTGGCLIAACSGGRGMPGARAAFAAGALALERAAPCLQAGLAP